MLTVKEERNVRLPRRTLESVLSHLPRIPTRAVFRIHKEYEKLARNSCALAPGLYLTHKPILGIQGYTEERMLRLYQGDDPRIDVICSVWYIEYMGDVGITPYEVLTQHPSPHTRSPLSIERIHAMQDLAVHSTEENEGRVRAILRPRIL